MRLNAYLPSTEPVYETRKESNVMTSLLPGMLNEAYATAPVSVFSSGTLWKNFRIEVNHYPPTHLHHAAMDEHMLICNLGLPLTYAWKTGGQWKKSVCNTGQVIALLSPGTAEEILCEHDHHALTLSFKTGFVNALTHTGNFSFKTLHNLEDALLKHITGALRAETGEGYLVNKMYAESMMTACIIHLVSTCGADGKKMFAPKGRLSSAQLVRVIDHTRASIHSSLSLAQLASCVHLSPFHFSRLFRQTVGVSPYRFVLQMKIELAKKLIRGNYGSLSDVAYALSFTDQAHFSNAFKKVTGMCPKEFLIKPLNALQHR